jgi:hypothetical protein
MSFSYRYGYTAPRPAGAELIREEAPERVRAGFLAIAKDVLGPRKLRDVVCATLRKRPDPYNWTDYPNIWDEVQELVYEAPWPAFYDIVEASLATCTRLTCENVGARIDQLFAEEYLAWRIIAGKVVLRTGEVSDAIGALAAVALRESTRPTAATELEKALAALSHRPEPDTRDAVRCAAGALEALARDITGERTATLGELLKRHGDKLLAPPLKIAFEKIWGYCSDRARHVDEHNAPTLEDAILVVGLVGAAVAYLARRRASVPER